MSHLGKDAEYKHYGENIEAHYEKWLKWVENQLDQTGTDKFIAGTDQPTIADFVVFSMFSRHCYNDAQPHAGKAMAILDKHPKSKKYAEKFKPLVQ
jgi:glutathione S-transferase